MPLDIQYDVLNDTPASASPVEANFNRIEQHVNQELISRDGTTAMTAQLKLVGDPISALDAAPKQYVDQILPVGIIMMYGGAAAPPGGRWAVCNGAELESAIQPELFAIIGQSFSPAATPAGRFHLPNLTDRFPMGRGAIAAIGAVGGSADQQVPKHSHTIDHSHPDSNSGGHSNDHWHGGTDHLHRVDIWSGDGNAWHSHAVAQGAHLLHRVAEAGSWGLVTGSSYVQVVDAPHYADGPGHQHPVNGVTGAADRPLNTGGVNANHTHATSTPAHSGRSGDEGVVVTNTNLPPYLGISYIIRIS